MIMFFVIEIEFFYLIDMEIFVVGVEGIFLKYFKEGIDLD